MPLYEYHCLKCEKNFDVIQKFSDAPLKRHEGCGGKVEKLMSAPSFHLKGSGWYATDYGKGGKAPAETKAEAKDGKSADAKASDSKPGPSTSAGSQADSKAESKPVATPAKSD